ncbi:hypothetical protein O1611_g1853 [Lasiodiplodia mahajangana]|uniref:Uncharacterized protein n=1 Tax=Lasiodiplodia mahajangana TaxID=1108764 RepID=A0ACC2JWX5_9PEZI|nr:hypothetical protein O1611_g1853 [Lasiodiplodia mahajangana]
MFPACPFSSKSQCGIATDSGKEVQRRSRASSGHTLLARPLRPTESCSPGDLGRGNPVSLAIRTRYTRVSKAREPRNGRLSRPRSSHSTKGDEKYQTLASSVSSRIDTPRSSCQSHASGDIEPPTNDCLPSYHQTGGTLETKTSGSPEDEYISKALRLSCEPKTEYQANQAAASDETRPLFNEYYERVYGKDYVEEEDLADTYWKWDIERQQWHHINEDTKSEAWFPG